MKAISLAIDCSVTGEQIVEAIGEAGLDTAVEVDLIIEIVERLAPWFRDVEKGSHGMPAGDVDVILGHRRRLRERLAKLLADADPKPAKLTALPRARFEQLTQLWRNYGEACRLENAGEVPSPNVADYEVELACAFKEVLDAAEVT